MDELSLTADFPAATRERWLALVEGALKGADFERRLVARTHEGLRIEPLYPKAAAQPQPWRAAPGRWRIAQRVDMPDPAAANELALADLDGGADALALVFDGAPAARGFGLRAETTDDLDRVLQGVLLDLIAVRIETAPFKGRAVAERIEALVARRGHAPGGLAIEFGLDPIGDMARTGGSPLPWAELQRRFAGTAAGLAGRGFGGPFGRIDTRVWHEAGAGEAQELAAALATGIAYLRAFEAEGFGLDAARRALSFLLAADADEFLTVAKLRALRRLWARVEEACGLTPAPVRLEAETAWRMATRRDPWVNLLRGTLAAFSAGIGGADGVTVLPFSAAIGLPDGFARRLARNTQLILMEEAHLWRVADPAAGAGGFEALTATLCEQAWALFQEIEGEGGMVGSLRRGAFQARVALVRTARETAVATRQDALTGTSEYANVREEPVSVLMPAPMAEGARDAGAARALRFDPLPSIRAAEPFERLRDRSDACLARTGSRPSLFLAILGTPSSSTARSTFARNVYEAAGIVVVVSEGCFDVEDLASAYRDSGAKLVCLCGTDDIYVSHAAEAARVLRESGASRISLAGRPGNQQQVWGRAGISSFIFVGCDALQALGEALEAAGA